MPLSLFHCPGMTGIRQSGLVLGLRRIPPTRPHGRKVTCCEKKLSWWVSDFNIPVMICSGQAFSDTESGYFAAIFCETSWDVQVVR